MMMKPASISTAWNTSVRDTARKPPKKTMKKIVRTPTLVLRPDVKLLIRRPPST